MFEYFSKMLEAVYKITNIGLAFNVMSKNVDWEREDLFHLPFDDLSLLIKQKFGNSYVIRNDYGLYEYTVYLLSLIHI